MSVRRAVARPAGIEDLYEAVGRYERSTLAENLKAALRFADAYFAHPAGFGAARRAELLEHYTPEQIVFLVFKLVYFSGNKASIALGVDAPIDENELSSFHYDEEGRFVVAGIGAIDVYRGVGAGP
jgi:hypothetical protein